MFFFYRVYSMNSFFPVPYETTVWKKSNYDVVYKIKRTEYDFTTKGYK